jgi:hypothetical protein
MQNPTTINPTCLFVHEIYNKFNFKLNRQLSPNDVRAYQTFFPWRSLYIYGFYDFIRTQNLVLCVCVYTCLKFKPVTLVLHQTLII